MDIDENGPLTISLTGFPAVRSRFDSVNRNFVFHACPPPSCAIPVFAAFESSSQKSADESMVSSLPKSTAYFEATDHFGFSRHVLKKFRTERLVVVSKSSGSHAISL
ncbi:MAG: hypothetical protein RBR16_10730, partial [Syntrophus sp. (in: bacteria)]|nr:hypothetical protein [Syntrophus sp. (in: bacteria)]